MNLLHLLDLSLIERSDVTALEFEGRALTFGEIESRSNRLARALHARGLRKGDRLGSYLANRVEVIDLYLACVKLGVIFVPINILYRGREIAHITSDAEPLLVVSSENLEALMQEAAAQSDERPSESLDGDTPAAIIYTSGTTGASKGAVLTHNNFLANAVNLVTCWRITDRDRFLLALPLFHIHALGNGLHCWLVSGCRMRLLERFDHSTARAELLDFRPTLLFGVPTVYVRLLETPPDGERRAGTVGFPLPGVSARILNEDGRDADEGELLVKGPTVFAAYWRRPDATGAAFTDGWFRTGDIASRSPDGYITLLGRKSDLIISGGYNIYPREIEELLLEQSGVREAAVCGMPDPIRGEVPVAYVVGEFDAGKLEDVCREQLASFKVPRRFVRVEMIPRTALGKVQKHLLK